MRLSWIVKHRDKRYLSSNFCVSNAAFSSEIIAFVLRFVVVLARLPVASFGSVEKSDPGPKILGTCLGPIAPVDWCTKLTIAHRGAIAHGHAPPSRQHRELRRFLGNPQVAPQCDAKPPAQACPVTAATTGLHTRIFSPI